jgi:aspartyl-tRNA(Asn)/glutamyl-tRNA(Gln) amidotransferase subunit A
MTELHWMTATQLIAAYRTKTLSPVEVAEYLLGRIEALDARTNAMCLVDPATTMIGRALAVR